MKIYIFDMDGTLTPARQPMTPDFSRRFLPWLKSHLAYLAAGSNYEKVTEQLRPMPLPHSAVFTAQWVTFTTRKGWKFIATKLS